MNNDNLLKFMQHMVDHPEEMQQFQQDPGSYLANSNFPQEFKASLAKLQDPVGPLKEVSTVFGLSVAPQSTQNPLQSDRADADKTIYLDFHEVSLLAPWEAVIIEPTIVYGEGTCKVIAPSYVGLDEHNRVCFTVHISYAGNDSPN